MATASDLFSLPPVFPLHPCTSLSPSQLPRQHIDAVYSLLKTPPWLLYCPGLGREQNAPCGLAPPTFLCPSHPPHRASGLPTVCGRCRVCLPGLFPLWGLLCSSSGVFETSFNINSNATPAATCNTKAHGTPLRHRTGAAFRKQPCPSLPLLVREGRALSESCWYPQR